MKNIGSFLVILGIAAIVLDFIHFVPGILAWIYNWGNGVAWGIKIAIIVVGAILYMIGNKTESSRN
jgi:hypothetical protein